VTSERSEEQANTDTQFADPQSAYSAAILDPGEPSGLCALEVLRDDPAIDFVDRTAEQFATLAELLPAPTRELTDERPRWAYYPWRRTVVRVLGPQAYARVRTDRNRNLITSQEQHKLASLRIGVVGLSVGHAVAHTLAMQGLCGELRLADFDDLELSNLNRVPATVFDLGLNKARIAARRIAEMDPYLAVRVLDSGVTRDTIDEFLDGLDIVVEECDSLDVKALVRESARARQLPVVMASSDRGLIDVERFDLDPQRPIFHGLLGDVDAADLAGLDGRAKIPHVLRIVDGGNLSARGAASLVEVGQTLSTWPQLAGDVLVGAAAVAEAVRRIGLGEPLSTGRTRLDTAAALEGLKDPANQPPAPIPDTPTSQDPAPAQDAVHAVALAASRAPSGGNVQPWHIGWDADTVTIRLAPEYQSMIDVGLRGSAVAVGAAAFNARVAAAAHHVLGPVEFVEGDGRSPLTAVVELGAGGDEFLASLFPTLAERETNRRTGTASTLPAGTVEALRGAAVQEGTRLELVADGDALDHAGALLAEADRIRYLTPHLHAEMASELRWPGDESPDSGIDVHGLELGPAELITLDILRRPEVMSLLAAWDTGASLGADTRQRVVHSSALAVIMIDDLTLTGHARGGAAAEAVWITAQQHGLAVQPISPVFLYAHTEDELGELSPRFAGRLAQLQSEFRHLTAPGPGEAAALILRLATAAPASVRSRRRPLRNAATTVF
jgi:molybdopterin/thiamine biosynthesis adenylyltransferase